MRCFLIALLFAGLVSTDVNAQRNKYSKPSRSRPSYSKPSYSRPKPSRSKYSKPSYTKPKKSKYSSGTKKTYRKPSSKPLSSKARAQKQAQSQKKYTFSKKATRPAKTSYVSKSGKTVKVNAKSKTVKTIRSKPFTYYAPKARTERITNHIHNHHYDHDYSWYRSQPSVYIGGGYSSAFWYMMMEWDAARRARWLYHNQNRIEQSAYERGMRDAAVAAEMAKLKGTPVNTEYVDPEFTSNPGMMYSQDYINAAYNPAPATASLTALWWILGITFVVAVFVGLYILVFRVKF